MIKINLLAQRPVEEGVDAASPLLEGMSKDDVQRQALVRIVFIILFPTALYVYELQNIPAKKLSIRTIESKVNELKTFNQKSDGAVKEIKKFQEDEKKIKAQISTLESLSKDRIREIQVLDLIQQVIPDRVWLNLVEISIVDSSKGIKKLKLRGNAASDSEITNFIDALSRSVFLNDVQPGGTTEGAFEGQKVRDFEITAMIGNPNE